MRCVLVAAILWGVEENVYKQALMGRIVLPGSFLLDYIF